MPSRYITQSNKASKKVAAAAAAAKPHLPAQKARQPESPSTRNDHPAADVISGPVFFWKEDGPNGYLCQWYRCTFADPELGGLVFNCAEQYMMYNKAMLFNDTASAAKIMTTTSPRKQKGLAREVQNFNEAKWVKARSEIVRRGNVLKFSQATNVASMKMGDVGEPVSLREMLMATEDQEMVEASPFDRVWGIGYNAQDALQVSRSSWGQNLLGNALMAARSQLREEDAVRGSELS